MNKKYNSNYCIGKGSYRIHVLDSLNNEKCTKSKEWEEWELPYEEPVVIISEETGFIKLSRHMTNPRC